MTQRKFNENIEFSQLFVEASGKLQETCLQFVSTTLFYLPLSLISIFLLGKRKFIFKIYFV